MFLNKYISKLLIFSLIIITFYNIFSIFIIMFNNKIEGFLLKSFKYTPYKYSVFFKRPFKNTNENLLPGNSYSKKFYFLLKETEKKSALDPNYWNKKLLYQITHDDDLFNFENNFQNAVILSKNNFPQKKIYKIFYLRNVPRFSDETKDIVLFK